MTDKGIKITNRQCAECGQGYEAREAQIPGITNPIVFGGGLCPVCSCKKLAEEEQNEIKLRELELKSKRDIWRGTCGIPLRFMAQRFETFHPSRSKSLHNVYKD